VTPSFFFFFSTHFFSVHIKAFAKVKRHNMGMNFELPKALYIQRGGEERERERKKKWENEIECRVKM
jgi:hypothetical protein